GFRDVWTGRPSGKPIAAVDGNTVYASWNGSTAVASWQVLAGSDAKHLSRVAEAPWNGLETAIPTKTSDGVVAVRALDATGRTLATSAVVHR
ncbi:MAG: arylsulfotransferase family protein, partial [Gaiellaceae bacterium]